jgi:hypothetical protein
LASVSCSILLLQRVFFLRLARCQSVFSSQHPVFIGPNSWLYSPIICTPLVVQLRCVFALKAAQLMPDLHRPCAPIRLEGYVWVLP